MLRDGRLAVSKGTSCSSRFRESVALSQTRDAHGLGLRALVTKSLDVYGVNASLMPTTSK